MTALQKLRPTSLFC